MTDAEKAQLKGKNHDLKIKTNMQAEELKSNKTP